MTGEKAGVFTVNCYSTSNPSDYNLRDSFILDSGATIHVCNSRDRFQTVSPASESDLLYAGNMIIPIEGFGSVDIIVQTPAGPKLIELQNTALVPTFHTSVVSLKRIVTKKVYWDMENDRLTQAGNTFCTVETRHDQWVLEYNLVTDSSAFTVRSAQPLPTTEASPLTWHLRLGHPNTDIVNHLPRSVIGAKVEKAPTKIECETCSVSKAKAIISRCPTVRPSAPYEEIAFDLVQMSSAHNDDWIFLHFLCLWTRMNHVYTLTNKREATLLKIIKELVAFVQTRYGCTVRVLRSDGERSLGDNFTSWIKSAGITFDPSAPYTPEQNGSAERSGGVIIQRARAMRVYARLPEDLWPEIVPAAAYILNRTPNRQLDWKTPIEVLHQLVKLPRSPLSIAHLRVYGARAYPLIHKIPKTEKLKSRAHIGYLVGYDSTNIFRIWIPSKKQVIRTRDVTFDETLFYDPGTLDITQQLQVEAEQVIEVVDMASSQPLIDRLDLDTDTDSDLDQTSEVQQLSNRSRSHELSKGVETPDDSLPDHRLPTLSETESRTLASTTISRQLTPESDVIVVGAPKTSSRRLQAESENSTEEDHKPGYKNNEVSADMSEDLILTNCRRRRQWVYLSAL